MGLLHYLVEVFINSFGITRPTEEKRNQVALVLGGFLVLVFLLVIAITTFMVYTIHHGR
ncbi:MAG: hypothetical protein ACR2JE_00590 [Acidobacteriaceae bacterium]